MTTREVDVERLAQTIAMLSDVASQYGVFVDQVLVGQVLAGEGEALPADERRVFEEAKRAIRIAQQAANWAIRHLGENEAEEALHVVRHRLLERHNEQARQNRKEKGSGHVG